MTFIQKIETRMDATSSYICVGIDPILEKIPQQFHELDDPFFEFGKWIIEETHENVIAYKPNTAYYEALGSSGIESLKKTCDYLRTNHPNIALIIDAKRGDIGHTNAQYAKFIFDYLGADAVTLQPYLGSEAVSEFFEYENRGLIFLCRTSNPGAGEFQDLLVPLESGSSELIPLWQKVAKEVTQTWQTKSKAELLLVVGATYPEELKKIRESVPNVTFLIPGVGAQGGDLEKTLQFGLNLERKGVIINSSRGIIYSEDPKQAVQDLLKVSKYIKQ